MVSPLLRDIRFNGKRKETVFRPPSVFLAIVGLQLVLGKVFKISRRQNMSPAGSMGRFLSDFH